MLLKNYKQLKTIISKWSLKTKKHKLQRNEPGKKHNSQKSTKEKKKDKHHLIMVRIYYFFKASMDLLYVMFFNNVAKCKT